MASNGRLPRSALRRIPGNGWLRRDAARAYRAMAALASAMGQSLALIEGPIRRTYRPLSAQWLAWNTLPRGQAAFPGTSNHGWGLAVDLMTLLQRAWIDRHGARFGWAKRWSDAAHEWWHLKWRSGVWKPPPPVRLTSGERAWVRELQTQRKIAKRNGGWSKVDPSHLRKAVEMKDRIRARRAAMRKLARKHGKRWWRRRDRRRRYTYLGRVLRG
jgi:hypothetical protein